MLELVLVVSFSFFEVPNAGNGGAVGSVGGAGGAGGGGGIFGTPGAFDEEFFEIGGGKNPGTGGLASGLELCTELMTFLSSLLALISDKNGNPPAGRGGAVGTFPWFDFSGRADTVGGGACGAGGGGGGILFGKGGADVGTGGGPLGNGGGFEEGSCTLLLF